MSRSAQYNEGKLGTAGEPLGDKTRIVGETLILYVGGVARDGCPLPELKSCPWRAVNTAVALRDPARVPRAASDHLREPASHRIDREAGVLTCV